jgi:hypothetical protein
MKDVANAVAILNALNTNTTTTTATIRGETNSTTGSTIGGSNNNGSTPAPTTAVAMSILYSITGIITLLFLIIIATGAVRAHRHPERYGPRNGLAGHPRQSRAKGLARAMLETIPIVKFGDPEPAKPGHSDIELENGSANGIAASVLGKEVTEGNDPSTKATQESGMGPDTSAAPVTSQDGDVNTEGDLGCSICTEDFTRGEDVRVLPCNHKYHPACIDPWLLNVSGTCPLW